MNVFLRPINKYQATFLSAVGFLCLSLLLNGWTRTWTGIETPILNMAFSDLYVIPSSLMTLEDGLDPRLSNPHHPLNTSFNYPSVWFFIGKVLHLTNTHIFLLLATTMAMALLAAWYYLLGLFPSILLLLFIFSDPTRSAITTGNIDTIAFLLIFTGLVVQKPNRSFIWMGLASFLKLYPLAALVTLARSRKTLMVVTGLVVLVIGVNFGDLRQMRLATPASAFAYGFISTNLSLQAIFGFTVPLPWLALFLYVWPISLGLLHKESDRSIVRGFKGHLFLIGAIVFVATYIVLGSNYSYRMIYLGLVIPEIIDEKRKWLRTFIGSALLLGSNFYTLHFLTPHFAGVLTLVGATVLFQWLLYRLTIELKSWYVSRSYLQLVKG